MNPYSAILPNSQSDPLQFYLQQQRQNQQDALQQQRYEQQLQMQKDRSFADLIDKIDLKNDLTGTAYDGYLNHNMQALLGNVANTYKSKGYTDALLEAARGANELKSFTDKIKAARANIFSQAEDYKNTPGLDYKRAAAMALTRAFHNYDEQNHQINLRDPADIDEQQDYLSDVLNNNYGGVWNGSGPLGQAVIDRQKHLQDYDKKLPRNIGGMIRDVASKGKFDPLVHLPVDAQGNAVDLSKETSLATGVKIKSEPVLNSLGQPVLLNGKPLAGVPDDTVNTFAATKGTDKFLNYAAKQFYPGLPLEQGRKVVLYDYLQNNPYGYIRPVEDKVSDAQIEREKAANERQQRGFDHAETMAAIRAGKGTEVSGINNAYGRIAKIVSDNGGHPTPIQSFRLDDQGLLMNTLKPLDTGKNEDGEKNKLSPEDVNVIADANGNLGLQLTYPAQQRLARDNAYLGSLPYTINHKVPGNNTKNAHTQINEQSAAPHSIPANTPSLNATQWKKNKK